jgi:phage protein D
MAEAIYLNETFFAPQFVLKLKGQNLGNNVVKDVIQVSYKDDLENLDAFEFTLHDWDPVLNTTKYSSPYDENGQLKKVTGSSEDIPNFEPGAQVELYMGYYGATELTRMMSGKVVSAAVSFPASGAPLLTVRVLNLLFDLQRTQQSLTFENKTPSEIASEIALGLDIPIETTASSEEVIEFIGMNNEYPIVFLMRLSRKLGYDLFVDTRDPDQHKLFFGVKAQAQEFELSWGKSLIQFTPVLKLKDLKEKVVVRGWNPLESGSNRAIVGEAQWSDLDIQMPDSKLLEQLEFAAENAIEEITEQPVSSEQAATELAKAALRKIVQQVITGSGATLGKSQIRAGVKIALSGLGNRYSAEYLVNESIHKIDQSGYTTSFSARMEIVNG